MLDVSLNELKLFLDTSSSTSNIIYVWEKLSDALCGIRYLRHTTKTVRSYRKPAVHEVDCFYLNDKNLVDCEQYWV